MDQNDKGQDYSEPSRSLKEEADKITLSSMKANTVGENQLLLDRYQKDLLAQKEGIMSKKTSKALSKKHSAREVEVDEQIS